MLESVTAGVWVHQSPLIQNNAVAIEGRGGVLLVDPGITAAELAGLAGDLRDAGLSVAAGFATHDHWDHVLWHPDFGDVTRYGTEQCAAKVRSLLSSDDWRDQLADGLPPEAAAEIPLDDLYGRITGLPEGTTHVPWDGPRVRILEHSGHAPGHAALLVEESRVLVAGDMLSDVLIPMLSSTATDPIGDYLAALDVFDGVASEVDAVVPGHGSVGTDVGARIAADRAYLLALRDGRSIADPRIDSPRPGWEWVADVHEGQRASLAR